MKRVIYTFVLLLAGFSVQAQTEAQEYNLKAVFIYNFTKYITWDNNLSKSEFVIGVLGSSPIIAPLNEIARTKTVGNKKIVIRQFKNPQDIGGCNILFISKRVNFPLSSILSAVPDGTLTIGEEEGLADEGAAFNFVIEESKLRFEANMRAIARSGLKASSDLLQHAIIVEK